eukprot:19467-Heterococcus_DN1.PRE.1
MATDLDLQGGALCFDATAGAAGLGEKRLHDCGRFRERGKQPSAQHTAVLPSVQPHELLAH